MMESSFIKVAHFTKIAFSELYIAFHKHHATNFKNFKSREWLKKRGNTTQTKVGKSNLYTD